MAEYWVDPNAISLFSGGKDKTQRGNQQHEELEAMPLHIQAQNKSQADIIPHNQQRFGSHHSAAQHNTYESRGIATMALNTQASSFISPYHHHHSTSGAMEAYPSPPSIDTPQNSYGHDRFGFEAAINAPTANTTNGPHQIARSFGTQSSYELHTPTTYDASYGQNMVASQSSNGDSPIPRPRQVRQDQDDITDQDYNHHQQSPFYTNFMNPDYSDHRRKAYEVISSAASSNSKREGRDVAHSRNAPEGFSHRKWSSSTQQFSTPRPAGDMAHGYNEDRKAGRFESLAALVRVSEHDTFPNKRASNPGPIGPPHRVDNLTNSFESTSKGGGSSLNTLSFQFQTVGHESPGKPENVSSGFQASTLRYNVSNIQKHAKPLRVSTQNDVAHNPIIWQKSSNTCQLQRVQQGKLYNERARSVDEGCWAATSKEVKDVAAKIQAEIDKLGFMEQFRPSNCVMKQLGLWKADESNTTPEQYGCSNNYRGDVTLAKNRSAEVADNQNCSVWVLGLPANVTHTELLGAIRNVGQIYCAVINEPTRQHQTSAAKIVFFERWQAERFMELVLNGNFQVMGRQIRHVRWNKIKSARYPYTDNSRVIHITGPRHLMSFGFFEGFFKRLFDYQLEGTQEVECAVPDMVTHEWRFGSFRSQAASAKTAIERELHGIFTVEWARDPCM